MDKKTLAKIVAFLTEVIDHPKTNEKTAYNTLLIIRDVLEKEARE